MAMLSKTERRFLEDVKKGDLGSYSAVYRRQLKHNILKKRKQLTQDLLIINEILDRLEAV